MNPDVGFEAERVDNRYQAPNAVEGCAGDGPVRQDVAAAAGENSVEGGDGVGGAGHGDGVEGFEEAGGGGEEGGVDGAAGSGDDLAAAAGDGVGGEGKVG